MLPFSCFFWVTILIIYRYARNNLPVSNYFIVYLFLIHDIIKHCFHNINSRIPYSRN
uniref:TLC domain-containing protein n=1 Tax=Anguilla anguilla TaxID=7936 RepID=A0A0E9RXJ9_ANGAN